MISERKKEIRLAIGNNIRACRENLGFSKVQAANQLSELVGKKIDSSAFSNWEKGVYSPDLSILPSICEVLDCEMNDIVDVDKNDPNRKDNMTMYYDRLTERQKETVRNVIKGQLGISQNEKIVPLKLFSQSACAGNGNMVDSDDFEIVEFVNPPKTAEFAVRVQGNSMEPFIDNGDIIYINPNVQLSDKEIGIFSYQGETFVKQLRKYQNKIILHSINPKFKDIEITSPDEFFICGRVLWGVLWIETKKF